jgi:transposase
MELPLSAEQKIELKRQHRQIKDKRTADRLKIIVMLDEGFTDTQICRLLMLDEETITSWRKKFKESVSVGEFLNLRYEGSQSRLSEEQIARVKEFINNNIVTKSKQIISFIHESFGVKYSASGIKAFLHKNGFSYKQLIKFNSKSNEEAQLKFINEFENLSKSLDNTGSIVFLDGVNPQHNTGSSKAWIEKGKDKFIECNSGRQRLNINGAYNPFTYEVFIEEGEKVNSQNTILLLKKIEKSYSDKDKIYAFSDNARYYKSKAVQEFLATSKIEIINLPPYCPNLNLIERLWKFMRKTVINTTYFAKFESFENAIRNFFQNINSFREELKTFIGLKMHVVRRT